MLRPARGCWWLAPLRRTSRRGPLAARTDPPARCGWPRPGWRPTRRTEMQTAAAAVELAVILPVLCLICVLTIDYSRIFVAWLTLAQAAYNGAYYQSDANVQANCGFSSVTQAVLADTGSLKPDPTVSTSSGTDANNNAYVQVTVSWTFTTIFTYPGVPTSTTLTRTLRMAKTPS